MNAAHRWALLRSQADRLFALKCQKTMVCDSLKKWAAVLWLVVVGMGVSGELVGRRMLGMMLLVVGVFYVLESLMRYQVMVLQERIQLSDRFMLDLDEKDLEKGCTSLEGAFLPDSVSNVVGRVLVSMTSRFSVAYYLLLLILSVAVWRFIG
ncbi:MAG: hypothetical protein ACF8GE_00305 [Phycisphaerales bacterium JB043]